MQTGNAEGNMLADRSLIKLHFCPKNVDIRKRAALYFSGLQVLSACACEEQHEAGTLVE
jgi:hypothetical protein